MVAGVGSSINSLLAANFSQVSQQSAVQQMRAQEASIKSQAQAAIGKAGPNATVTTSYSYGQGPDGQLYVTGVTVSAQKKVEGVVNPLTRDGRPPEERNNPFYRDPDTRHQTLRDLVKAKPDLLPSEEAQLFSVEQFRDASFNSVDNLNRSKYQAADFGVRTHEAAHYRVGAGVTSTPEYTFEEGPDGVFYAVAGEVGVSRTPNATPEQAAREAGTAARAALAAGDASAQDVASARTSQSEAASFKAQANKQQQVADLYQRNFKALFNGEPAYNIAA